MAASDRAYRPGAPIVAEIASGAVVVRGDRVLLLHQARDDRWCLPKGHVDPGESLGAAALREVREESGLSDVVLGDELAEVTYRFFNRTQGLNVHKTVVYFLGRSEGGSVTLEPIFDAFDWAPLDRALALVPFETDRRVLETARGTLSKDG